MLISTFIDVVQLHVRSAMQSGKDNHPRPHAEERLKGASRSTRASLKGAQPTDRVARLLDGLGVMKREARSNPQKAQPKKKAQERAAAAAAAAGAAEAPAA